MELRSGTWTVGPAEGALVVRTMREGADASIVRATVASGSLVVAEATGGAIGLSALSSFQSK